MDKFTSTGQRLAFARVLAEVSTDSNLPDSVIIGCKDNTLEQAVEYVWKLWKPIALSEMQNIHSLIKKLPTSS